ncbi:MAG: hypothetical protein AAF577_14120 [Pseudomonadota bacterium]
MSPDFTLKGSAFPLVKEAILHGGGIGIMLEDSVYDDPRLVAMAIKGMNRRYAIHLMTQPERRNLRIISRFYDTCAEEVELPRV